LSYPSSIDDTDLNLSLESNDIPWTTSNSQLLQTYTPNNDVQQSEMPSGLFLMKYHWWRVQSYLSVSPEFLILLRTSCSLKFHKGKSNRVKSRDLGGKSCSSYWSLIKYDQVCERENFSHRHKVRWNSTLLVVNLIFIIK
jgi:hypothetical protein